MLGENSSALQSKDTKKAIKKIKIFSKQIRISNFLSFFGLKFYTKIDQLSRS